MQIYKVEIRQQNLFRLNINNIFYRIDLLAFRHKKIPRVRRDLIRFIKNCRVISFALDSFRY
jgi:hypothetical protein